MKVQTVTQIILTAQEGCLLTNGETGGKTVILPADADISLWKEVEEVEALKSLEEEEEADV